MSNTDLPLWVVYYDTWSEKEYFYVRAHSIKVAVAEFFIFCARCNVPYGEHLICRLEK